MLLLQGHLCVLTQAIASDHVATHSSHARSGSDRTVTSIDEHKGGSISFCLETPRGVILELNPEEGRGILTVRTTAEVGTVSQA